MADEPRDADLPISWDEAREVAVVLLLVAAGMAIISPVIGWFDTRVQSTFGDDLAFVTSRVSPSSSLLLLAAALIIATTPRGDVVPALRRAVAIVATVAVVMGVVAIIVELTRVSGAGVAARLQSVFGRSGPATLIAGLSRWLALRVVPFDD